MYSQQWLARRRAYKVMPAKPSIASPWPGRQYRERREISQRSDRSSPSAKLGYENSGQSKLISAIAPSTINSNICARKKLWRRQTTRDEP